MIIWKYQRIQMLNIFSSLYTVNVIFCNKPRFTTVHHGKTREQSFNHDF